MADWQAIAADPIKYAKKKPLIAAGVIGGAFLLVILFKPKNTSSDNTDLADYVAADVPEYSMLGDNSSGGGGVSSSDNIAGSGVSQDSFDTGLNDLAEWIGISLDEYYHASNSDLKSAAINQVNNYDVFTPEPTAENPGYSSTADILAAIARNAANARNIFTDSWNTPELNALHDENLQLAGSIGGVYDPATGAYSYKQGTAGYNSIEQQMALNSAKANAIYATVNDWSDPAIQRLHDENKRLAAQIGKNYDPTTGLYSQSVVHQQTNAVNPETAPKTYSISHRDDELITNKNDVKPATTVKDSSGNVTGMTASNGVTSNVVETSGGKIVTVDKSGFATVGDTEYTADGKGGWKQIGDGHVNSNTNHKPKVDQTVSTGNTGSKTLTSPADVKKYGVIHI